MKYLFIFLFPFLNLFSLDYGLDAKREGTKPIRKLQIFSERCSGSNYLRTLLDTNFSFKPNLPNNDPTAMGDYGHKHFPPWFELPIENFSGPNHYYTFNGNEDYLFVVIFRDPYDWIRSFYNTPFHAKSTIRELPFNQFIRTPWELKHNDPIIVKQQKFNSLIDYDYVNNAPFENPLKLRTAKIRNMMMIKDRVKNIYYVNYEVVRDFPKQVIAEISKLFGLTPKQPFTPITKHNGDSKKIFKPKKYCEIDPIDLAYINEQLDQEIEEAIGYPLKTSL